MGPMLQLGPLPIDPPLVLAPMAGITDHVYRLMLRRIGGVGPRDDGVHLLRGDHAGQRAPAAQDALFGRGAAALDPDLRVGPRAHGGGGRHRRGARARRLRHQHGLPGEQGPQGLRRRGADGRPAARARNRALGEEAADDAADGEVPPGPRRPPHELSRPRAHVRGRGRGGGRDARAHGAADVHRAGGPPAHRRAEAATSRSRSSATAT